MTVTGGIKRWDKIDIVRHDKKNLRCEVKIGKFETGGPCSRLTEFTFNGVPTCLHHMPTFSNKEMVFIIGALQARMHDLEARLEELEGEK